MRLKALVFDVDGTLADTEETHRQAFNDAFLRFALPWEWTKAGYRELLAVSGGRERMAHFIDTLTLPDDEKARLRTKVPAIHREKTRLYAELIGDGRCPLRPGVRRILDEAGEGGVQLAIASTTTAANVYALLARHLGDAGRRRFRVIACAEHVERKKPAPDIYRLVAAMLGRSPSECVAFEDSDNGVQAATRAGLFTVVTPSQWTDGSDFGAAQLVLPHLGDRDCPLVGKDADRAGGPWLSLGALADRHSAMNPRAAA